MNDQSSPSEADLLAEMKRSWAESFHFYSDKGKEERERWVVGKFLNLLSVTFVPDELHSPPQQSKVDVEFRLARFQVKEIPDPNLRRSGENKDTHRRVMEAKTLQDIVGPVFGCDVPPVISGYNLMHNTLRELALSGTYEDDKATLDLLFYVTYTRASVVRMQDIKLGELSSFGWRSVSCLMGSQALVLSARLDAPTFLRPTP